ncbi:MAG TPA: dodecin family protein [Thermoanaerobaculia bacterium]|nr:dodecin family protein [Thermoanaerobaculia bacterium]
MSVAKVVEISAESPESFEAAIREGISRASKTVNNIRSAWVKEQKVRIEDGRPVAFRVHLQVTFRLDE